MKRPIWVVVSDLTSGQRFRLHRSKFTEVKHQFLAQMFFFNNFWPIGSTASMLLPLCSSRRDKSNDTQFDLKSQGQSLTQGERSSQVKVGHVAHHSIWNDETSILVPFSFVYHTWFKRYRQKKLILPQAYNGSSSKMTWPEVTTMRNPRYTFCRYSYP